MPQGGPAWVWDLQCASTDIDADGTWVAGAFVVQRDVTRVDT